MQKYQKKLYKEHFMFSGEKDLHEDVEEQPENDITQNKESSITEEEMNTKVTQDQPSIPVIDLSNPPQAQSTSLDIIELSDDDDDLEDDKDKAMWLYECLKGETQGPFSLTALKRWSDFDYFTPDFKVWKTGQSKEKSAVLLTKLLHHIKPQIEELEKA